MSILLHQPFGEVPEQVSIVLILWLLLKCEVHHLLEVVLKFTRHPIAQKLTGCAHLLLHDDLILFMLGLCFGTLPWQLTPHHINHDVAY
ncbi:hypothetical protein FGO68_gene4393 [Halteria grandinella]|uniref:Uncharacterized protein n=1 Tax=Halteria grandinella TaxID=5974 RepID=A0A8J8P087_HALGN|nr:hypothetical protein FGO68_gene4393 [Halteria grandinella]